MLHKKLSELRNSKGYSQEQVSEITGITQAWISKLERKIDSPSKEMIEKLAKFYDFKDVELFAAQYFEVLPDKTYKQALKWYIKGKVEDD